MLFTFMLASTLAASAVLGRSSGPTPTQITYMKEEQIQGQIKESAQVVAVGDRSSNLKYVMAIQSSSIWTDIIQRSLTINSPQRLDASVAEKSPNDLSDEELAQLKQACHDGLKCVAVDQLLVLKRVREPLGDGNTSVRLAIIKITQVITKYTTEYHEDVYQYEEVTQSDDPSKVYESVTKIVEDNKELCQIDLVPDTRVKNTTEPPKKNEGDARPTTVVNNNNTVNYNTTNNYNINDGTINNANINLAAPEGADGVSVTLSTDDSPVGYEPENRSPNDADQLPMHRTAEDSSLPAGIKSSVAGSPENSAAHKRVQRNVAQDNRQENASANDSPPALLMITDGPHDENAHDSAGRPKTIRARPDDALKSVTDNNASVSNIPNVDGGNSRRDTDRTAAHDVDGNTAKIVNSSGGGSGDNDSDADIVSAGSGNRENVKKGLVEDGYFNNGNMKVKNFDRSNRNKGTIKDSTADQGIIGIGTINNGPVNYGTSNTSNNEETVVDKGDFDIQEYATSIDEIYSAILNKLDKID